MRILARPRNAASSLVTYRSRWIYGGTFLTALSGQQSITGTGQTDLLGQSSYVNVTTQGTLTTLTLRGYPDTAHPNENTGGGASMLDRSYTLTPDGSNFSLTLCLAYEDSEIPGGVNETDLGLCRWTDSAWSCPARSASSDTTNNLVCADNVTGFSDWTMGGVGPTAVTLVSFTATLVAGGIRIAWETASEVDILGFNLYRSQTPDGEYTRLAYIPARGDVAGAVYTWGDGDVQPGVSYYYKLEELGPSGQGVFHAPVTATLAGRPAHVLYLPLVVR